MIITGRYMQHTAALNRCNTLSHIHVCASVCTSVYVGVAVIAPICPSIPLPAYIQNSQCPNGRVEYTQQYYSTSGHPL